MTELRRRMDDDMLVRGFADRTRESYLWAVTGLARFPRWTPENRPSIDTSKPATTRCSDRDGMTVH
jgi:hypothetical protein